VVDSEAAFVKERVVAAAGEGQVLETGLATVGLSGTEAPARGCPRVVSSVPSPNRACTFRYAPGSP
jgi:hypothetical protein